MSKNNFRVYDTVDGYVGKPAGIFSVAKILYQSDIWGTYSQSVPPPESQLVSSLRLLPESYEGPVVLDIEQWDAYASPTALGYIIDIIRWYQAYRPKCKIGLYSIAPYREPYASLLPVHSANRRQLGAKTDKVAALFRVADFICPSLYTFYQEQDLWERYAKVTIDEVRRYVDLVPIYPFLWPRYHNFALPKGINLTPIEKDYWARQLEFCYQYADSIFIWEEESGKTWDEQLGWISATRAFNSAHNISID